MTYITKITTQKNNSDRYNVFIDDGEGEKYAFSIDEDVFIKFQLKKGMELDELTKSEILFHDDIRKGLNHAIYYLSFRMRSETEVRDFLKKKEIDFVVIPDIIRKLYTLNYLNDEEFALAYARTQINTTDKGPNIIKQELVEKGINEAAIEVALQQYSSELRIEKATVLYEKQKKKYKSQSERLMIQKIEQNLVRKGYDYATISLAKENTNVIKDEDEEWEALCKQANKVHNKYKSFTGYEYEQKMKMALYRKGFSLDLIQQWLDTEEKE